MGNPRFALTEFLSGLGYPGMAGALLLLGGAAYGLAFLLPQRHTVEVLQERIERAEHRAAALRLGTDGPLPAPPTPAEVLYAALSPSDALAPQVERIHAAAAGEQLVLLQGEYGRSEVPGTRLVRYRISLPLRGSFAQVRRFIAGACAAVPGLTLDDLQLQRQSVAEAQVDARVQFSLFLARR